MAAAGFGKDAGFDPEATRKTLTTAPTLVLAGALDPAPTPEKAGELAAVFRDGHLTVDPDSAHFPWITGPDFAETIEAFLR